MADPQATDTAPIGRISLPEALPGIGQTDVGEPSQDQTAIPSLNPADSPYKPLTLPRQEVRVPPPEQEQQAPNGAMSHAGGIAYLVSQSLRGLSRGIAQGKAYAADQYNKKLTAQESLFNQLSEQVHDMASSGNAGTFSGPPGKDGKPTFVPNPEFTKVRQQTLAVWQALMDTTGQTIPKAKGKKEQREQQEDPNTLMQQMLAGKTDPQGAAYATHKLASLIGPPVFHQVAGFLTPQYMANLGTAAKTQQAQGAAGASTADTGATVADINNKLAHAVSSGAPQDQIDALIKQRDELNPSQKFPIGGLTRYGEGDEERYEWQVDQEGNEIPHTRRLRSTAGLNPSEPKVGSFGDFMVAAYGPKPTPKQYIEGQKAWAQSKAGTTVGTHTVLVTQGDKQVPFTFTTTSGKNFGGNDSSVPAARAGGEATVTPPTDTATPATPRTMVVPNPKGLVEPGNLPIDSRPTIQNADGSHSSEYSVSFADDKGREVLVPTVVGGKFLTPDGKKPKEGSPEEKAMFKAAWKHYLDTGENLGKFDNPDDADAYAEKLHNRGAGQPKPKATRNASPPAGHGPIQSGPAIGYKDSPELKALVKQSTDTENAYKAASTNLNTMLKTAEAAKHGDGAAQVGIISAYLKTVVGGQGTGVRITKAEWDAAVKTRTIPESIKASFSPDGFLTGAAISSQQVDQMMNAVHQKTKALYETAQSTKQKEAAQRQADIPANLRTTPAAPASQSTSLDDEILNLVKH